MVFSSMVFIFLFLPIVCMLYYAIPNLTYRNVILCASSLFFYAWGEPSYVVLMLFSIMFNFICGRAIEKSVWHRKAWFVFTVVVNVLLLCVFKYTGFIVRNVNVLLPIDIPVPSITLPIGISFYTFQALSYIIDVYRREVRAQRNIIDLTLYISLFPQLIAGPIIRYSDIRDEIEYRTVSFTEVIDGLMQFITGLAAKVIIANNMAVVADSVFADYKNASAIVMWLAAIAYTLQIYFDFSGYSRMAIGLGKMFGFHFTENFDYPYTATSITDFWRRWHITLSTWFRDYVYIPLGGNRGSTWMLIRNITVTWMLTGLWHGAEWNFILWGLYYAVLLLVEKIIIGKKRMKKIPAWLGRCVTMFFVVIGWVLFKTTNSADIPSVFIRLFTPSHVSTVQYFAEHAAVLSKLLLLPIAVAAALPLWKKWTKSNHRKNKGYAVEITVACVLFVISICMLVASTYNPFIYFRF